MAGMVVIASYADPGDAERAAARLRRSGIDCTVGDSSCNGMQPHWSADQGGYNLSVPQEAVMTALMLLQSDGGNELITFASE